MVPFVDGNWRSSRIRAAVALPAQPVSGQTQLQKVGVLWLESPAAGCRNCGSALIRPGIRLWLASPRVTTSRGDQRLAVPQWPGGSAEPASECRNTWFRKQSGAAETRRDHRRRLGRSVQPLYLMKG